MGEIKLFTIKFIIVVINNSVMQGAKHHDAHGKKGHFAKGHHHDNHKGNKGSHGDSGHHSHHEDYGHKGGHHDSHHDSHGHGDHGGHGGYDEHGY